MKDVPHYASCHIAITFNDDNLLLASKPRNYPLFITCYIREQKVKQILVDWGSAINIIAKSIMNDFGITVEELFKNQNGDPRI